MKPAVWLRITAGLYAFFTLGHGVGGNIAHSRGATEEALFAAMRAFTFPVQGFTRSHWEIYRGFNHVTTAMLVLMTALAWQLGTLSKGQPQTARPLLVLTLLLASAALAILGWTFFFTAPAATATLATLMLAVAWVRLGSAS